MFSDHDETSPLIAAHLYYVTLQQYSALFYEIVLNTDICPQNLVPDFIFTNPLQPGQDLLDI